MRFLHALSVSSNIGRSEKDFFTNSSKLSIYCQPAAIKVASVSVTTTTALL